VTAALPLFLNPLPHWVPDHIANTASAALLAELDTWPKPGLVSHVDQGSHTDMDAGTFQASTAAIVPFFAQLTEAGAGGADLPALRDIGLAAERAMLSATGGVNTHRGAIFGLGLLCAAAGASWSSEHGVWQSAQLAEMVRRRWGGSILRGPIPLHSHGTEAWRRFGAGGARAQAAAGFPHALEVGLPAMRQARLAQPDDPQASRVQAFFALLAEMEDTNLLYRGGAEGLSFAQQAAAGFLARGGVGRAGWREDAASVHWAFVARRLSPGGCADLLAISLFLDSLDTEARAMRA
jgi:triphosphoribosyl-dephospho-CoA synthase